MKKAIITLNPDFLKHFSENKIDLDKEYDYVHMFNDGQHITASGISLLKGLFSNFENKDLGFVTTNTILGTDGKYKFNGTNFEPDEFDLKSYIWLIFSYDTSNSNYGFDFVNRQISFYANNLDDVVFYLNNPLKKNLLDKSKLYDSLADLLPNKFDFKSREDIKKYLKNNEELILKHRMGADGEQVYKLDNENVDSILANLNGALNEYLLQEKMNIVAEKRLLYFGDEFVGAYKRSHKKHPWQPGSNTDYAGYESKTYNPTMEELALGDEIMKKLELDYGSVDFAQTPSSQYLLEVNGMAPGLITPTYPQKGLTYDLGSRFGKFIAEKVKSVELLKNVEGL